MSEPTNADLMKQLEDMARRINSIEQLVQRATGMWLLSKWIAGGLLALVVAWGSVRAWWSR